MADVPVGSGASPVISEAASRSMSGPPRVLGSYIWASESASSVVLEGTNGLSSGVDVGAGRHGGCVGAWPSMACKTLCSSASSFSHILR